MRINGDVALLKGIMKEMLEEEERRPGEVLDHEFIKEHTDGFEEFRGRAPKVQLGRDWWSRAASSRDEMREAARIMIMAPSARSVCWAMGLTQHKNAVANIQEIVNLLLLRGQIGKPGAGVCPVRGH